jgi:hypothetical protein
LTNVAFSAFGTRRSAHDSTSFTNTPFPNPKLGSKEIFHLEAFVAKFMSVYKRFILDIDFDF